MEKDNQQPKRYRLLQTWFSPKVNILAGSIFVKHINSENGAYTCGNTVIHPSYVENHPDWFELISEDKEPFRIEVMDIQIILKDGTYLITEKYKECMDVVEQVLNDDVREEKMTRDEFEHQYGVGQWATSIPNPPIYNQQQLDEEIEKAFNAARERIGGWWNDQIKNWTYPSISDYKHKRPQSLPRVKEHPGTYSEKRDGHPDSLLLEKKEQAPVPDWEIVAYRVKGTNHMVYVDKSLFGSNADNYCAKSTAHEIFSVKRLSDGEVFFVGEKVKRCYSEEAICGFEVNSGWKGDMRVFFNNNKENGTSIVSIQKLPASEQIKNPLVTMGTHNEVKDTSEQLPIEKPILFTMEEINDCYKKAAPLYSPLHYQFSLELLKLAQSKIK